MTEDRVAAPTFWVTRNATTPLPVVVAVEFNEIQSAGVLGVHAQALITLKLPEPPDEVNDAAPPDSANTQGPAPV